MSHDELCFAASNAKPLASPGESNAAGVQPSSGTYIGRTPPETPSNNILVEAADALALIETYIEKWTDALRYFADLGNSSRPRDFADVKRNLSNTHTLLSSSAAMSLRIRELASRFRVLAAENLPQREFKPTEMSTASGPTRHDVQDQPPGKSTRQLMPQALSPGSEERKGDGTMNVANHTLQADHLGRQKEQGKQSRVDMVLSEIESLLRIDRREEEWPVIALNAMADAKSTLIAPQFEHQCTKPKAEEPASQEVESLLGKDTASIFPEMEAFLTKQ